ncbi:MAG: AbrB/MazE/SpoVT family DNA-binding domain-containing protein [Thermoprotei archaeon]|nr:MAG: AbrB/MazE/SpoVT family DNA-binding domain-containing protein [Thermoprotei archaeon]
MNGKVLGAARVTGKGQVQVPKAVRERFNLKVGDLVLFIEEDGKLVLRKGEL